jgi:hypothetical protein
VRGILWSQEESAVKSLSSPPWHARDDIRLSKLDERDHSRIRVDPRFLELVRLAEAKLKARPRELDEQAVGNIMNGERITICCTFFCC